MVAESFHPALRIIIKLNSQNNNHILPDANKNDWKQLKQVIRNIQAMWGEQSHPFQETVSDTMQCLKKLWDEHAEIVQNNKHTLLDADTDDWKQLKQVIWNT